MRAECRYDAKGHGGLRGFCWKKWGLPIFSWLSVLEAYLQEPLFAGTGLYSSGPFLVLLCCLDSSCSNLDRTKPQPKRKIKDSLAVGSDPE